MLIDTFLLLMVVLILCLILRKLIELLKTFEEVTATSSKINEEQRRESQSFQDWLFKNLETTSKNITELTDVLTVENPAWGKDSASNRKKTHIVQLYSKYLVESEQLSREDALCKAQFVIDNCKLEKVNEEIERNDSFNQEMKSKKELLMSSFFKKEVEDKASNLTTREIYESIYIAIAHLGYKAGCKLLQNTRRPHEYSYDYYIKCAAIIHKLKSLKIIENVQNDEYSFAESQARTKLGVSYSASANEVKSAYYRLAKKYHPEKSKENVEIFSEISAAYKLLSQPSEIEKTRSGQPFYMLKEDDLNKIREAIFIGDDQSSKYFTDDYFDEEYSQDTNTDLPFRKVF